jgi:hypothetical protein
VYKVEQVPPALLVLQVQLALAVTRAHKVFKVYKVLTVRLVPQARQATATLQLQLTFLQQIHKLVTPGLTPQLDKSTFGMIHFG